MTDDLTGRESALLATPSQALEAALRQALGRLSEDLRFTVFLVLEVGMSHAEAGEALGVSEKTVSWQMHEVRERLRDLDGDEESAAIDDLTSLESALRATSLWAPEAVRERVISEALAAFDRYHQGMGSGARHTEEAPKRAASWIRRLVMPMSRPSFAFAGSAAVLVVAGIVSHQVLITPRPPPPAPAGVESPDRTGTVSSDEFRRLARRPAEAADAGIAKAPQRLADSGPDRSDLPLGREEAAALEHRVRAESADAPRSLTPAPWPAAPEMEDYSLARVAAQAPEVPSRLVLSHDDLFADSHPSLKQAPEVLSPMPALLDGGVEEGLYVSRERGRDRFTSFDPNPVKVVADEPVSTFSIDVDTAAYGYMRASLNRGLLPEKDAVRIEELINYFPYGYAPPRTPDTPFATRVSLMPAPWNDASRLMHISIKGYLPERRAAPRANLVFLIDTSGSMDAPNKLPLLIGSFKLLLDALAPEDRVAIVVYAGSAGVVLPPTRAAERTSILASLEGLQAGGSTAGAEGIRQAYRLAREHWRGDGVNRVILATDGDFNVGLSSPDELESYIARQRASGVFLSVLGFGMGNYNDALMQRLAQHGNGAAAYIDTLSEARKVLVEESASTLFPIAKDVKVQVEFNPAAISEYRLIGYETRMLAREDFRNDKVDAGEIGAGHAVTALYEVTPAGSGAEQVAPLRYRRGEGAKDAEAGADFDGELAFVKIRYKLPEADASTLITRPVTPADGHESVAAAPPDTRFAAAVAGFGQLLRGGRYTGGYGYDEVIALAQGARGEDPFGYRAEFVGLVRLARSLASAE